MSGHTSGFMGSVVVSMSSRIKRVFLKLDVAPINLWLLQEQIPSIRNITARGTYNLDVTALRHESKSL